MLLQVILEGIGLGVLLILVCAIGIRKGAVGMVHLYSQEVQERCVTLGLTTHEKIKRNALLFKAICVPGYIAYVLVCVYAVNGARGFRAGMFFIGRKFYEENCTGGRRPYSRSELREASAGTFRRRSRLPLGP